MSVNGYLIWFIVTTIYVTTIVAAGIFLASRSGWSWSSEKPRRDRRSDR